MPELNSYPAAETITGAEIITLTQGGSVRTVTQAALVSAKVSAAGGDTSTTVARPGTTYVQRTAAARLGDFPSVFDCMIPSDTTSDYAPAINRGLAAFGGVLLPPGGASGVALPISAIAFPNHPAMLRGLGTCASQLVPIAGTTGLGHIVIPPSNDSGAVIEHLGLVFTQPDATSGFTTYIPAICLNNAARVKLFNVRLQAGTKGILGIGNCGGLTAENMELSCFDTNVTLDECYDTVRFKNPHVWPFGLTANQQTAFELSASGYRIGRVDGIVIFGGLTFLRNAMTFSTDTSGAVSFGSITDHDFDNFGGFSAPGADLKINGSTFTLGDPTVSAVVDNSGTGSVDFNNCEFLIGVLQNNPDTNAALVFGAGTRANINGGRMEFGADCRGMLIDGATTEVSVRGMKFNRPVSFPDGHGGTVAAVWTRSAVTYSGGAVPQFCGNRHSAQTNGSTPFLTVTTDTPGIVSDNLFGNTALHAATSFTQLLVSTNAGVSTRVT